MELDHRSDIYSLGCVLYETLTGQLPFDAPTAVKMLSAHVYENVQPPSEIAPEQVSPALESIVLKAMAKDPDERFQSGLEMLEALSARQRELEKQRGAELAETSMPVSDRRHIQDGVESNAPLAGAGKLAAAAGLSVQAQPATSSSQAFRALMLVGIGATGMLLVVLILALGIFLMW